MRYFELLEAVDVSDPAQVTKRINLYQKIIDQSHHTGEKENARAMMDKLIAAAKAAGSYKTTTAEPKNKPTEDDIMARARTMANNLLKYITDIDSGILKETNRKELTNYFYGHYSRGNMGVLRRGAELFADLVLARQSKPKQESTSNVFKIVFIGHFQDEKSDKIWGWGAKGSTIYQFWGKRGGTPSVKVLEKTSSNLNAIDKLASTKEAKGYRKVPAADFEDWIRKVLVKDPKFSN